MRCSALIARFAVPSYLGRFKGRFCVGLLHPRRFSPFSCCSAKHRNWRRMTSFVSLLPRKRSLVPVRFHRLNCSSVVAIVAEIVETKIFFLAREVENKTYKGEIVLISER